MKLLWQAGLRKASLLVRPRASMMRSASASLDKRSIYTSLHDVPYNVTKSDCFAVIDDGYDASKYGYRVFVPSMSSSPSVGNNLHSAATVRSKSTMAYTHTLSAMDDYMEYMNNNKFVDPRSLDILSSPEVLEILQSSDGRPTGCNDVDSVAVEKQGTTSPFASTMVEDPYFSDCEEMLDGWDEPLPSLDEKEM